MNANRMLTSLLAVGLAGFTLRRWIFTFAALRQDPEQPARRSMHEVDFLVIVPMRNEAQRLQGLLHHLAILDPQPSHRILFVDDGSTDQTAGLVREWCSTRTNADWLHLPESVGKAEALNRALAHEPAGELAAVFDADERPAQDVLAQLAAPFADPSVGGVSGQRAVLNPLAGPAAGYAALEALVHQWITMRAKDRLGLQPALLGSNCAYRRQALADITGFTPGLFLEDSDATVRLALRGWTTRFAPGAASAHAVPEDLAGYWAQHTRWAAGFNQVGRQHTAALLKESSLPLLLRIELAVFSSGYFDRLLALPAAGLYLLGRAPASLTAVLAVYLLTPLLQTVAALRVSRSPETLYGRLPVLPVFYLVDIGVSVFGFLRSFRRSSGPWRSGG